MPYFDQHHRCAVPVRLLPGVTDAYWDLTTIRYYARYVSENIFAPAGVTSTLDHTGDNAFAYPFPVSVPGWSSGDLSTMSGCVAWHLSVSDLLNVMAAFRRRGTIIDSARAQTMLDRKFGLDEKKDTPLGRIYAKGGFWSSDATGRFVEQSNAFFLPKGMELVILANSPFCQPNTDFMDKVHRSDRGQYRKQPVHSRGGSCKRNRDIWAVSESASSSPLSAFPLVFGATSEMKLECFVSGHYDEMYFVSFSASSS